jgi:diaminohydroxyphosphoribosylaminopyrimidine deaminase/5-amino-6-(5-phosphoribosylamino)uracil reductase
VKDGLVIAGGYHQRFGGPHAEREALSQLPTGAAVGATAYVTLEPCCHHGKTPPCTDALIAAGVKRVCCASLDPFPQVSGQGVAQLQAAGIEVDVLKPEQSSARRVLAPYLKRLTRGLPYVIAKWAMSLDGKMATRTGDSRWISGVESRAHAHATRSRMDAIIVGSRTAQLDDPMLTARPAGARIALRVVVDSQAQLALDSQLVRTAHEAPVLVWASDRADASQVKRLIDSGCRVELSHAAKRLDELLRFLVKEYQATNVLCEGGGQLLGGLFDERLVDECHVYVAPKIIGGSDAIAPCAGLGIAQVADGPRLEVIEQRALGADYFWRAVVE